MKCTGENVIIQEIIEAAVSDKGIFLGETKDVKFKRGQVLAFGDKVKNIDINDTIWFDGYRSSDITYKGMFLKIINYADIVIIE